ncbi:MAG: orotate phosphoribosyltransferase [Porphyromonadaceae bacterium]|nr:orotate phosphoribosyltransferase [Porphyromonadaceae bacterium]
MNFVHKLTAEKLLKVKAIKLQPSNPFTWASGWKSPIYCDNRKLMSYPVIRNFIKVEFARIVLEKYPQTDAIAGVATGAIAPGALVADLLGLPFVYIRSTPKDHGLENLIEGDLRPGQKVIVIEDLVSTGGSSLKAVEAIRSNGSDVLGMLAIFTYGFPYAVKKMQDARVELTTLCNYDAILDEALQTDYIDESELKTLQEWRHDPENWGQVVKKAKK